MRGSFFCLGLWSAPYTWAWERGSIGETVVEIKKAHLKKKEFPGGPQTWAAVLGRGKPSPASQCCLLGSWLGSEDGGNRVTFQGRLISPYHADCSGKWEGKDQGGRGMTTSCQKNSLSTARVWGATPWQPPSSPGRIGGFLG